MKVPVECEHTGGIPELKVGARSLEMFGGSGARAIFKWEDGERIPGKFAMYDTADYPECFKIIQWKEITPRSTVNQWLYGWLHLLRCVFG